MKRSKLIFYILSFTFLVKCLLGYLLPLAGDESYYWVWGQNLQLSYFDHPGMVAWLASLTRFIPYLPEWFSVRLIFILVSTLTLWVAIRNYILVQTQTISNKSILFFTFFFLANPLLGVGGFLVTPDVPLLLFWTLSLWALTHLLITANIKYYALLGTFLGLGFCSKYHIVFFPLTVFISLLVTQKMKLIKIHYIPIVIVFGLIFSSPVLIWNYQNAFSSFKFQLNHGLKSNSDYQMWWTYSYILGQLLIFNPILLFNSKTFKKTISSISAYLQWLFFLYSSFQAKVEANWPVTAHSMALNDINFENKKNIKFAVLYSSLTYLAVVIFCFTPQFQIKANTLPTSDAVKVFYMDIQNLDPVFGPTYQLSSLIQIMTGKKVYKLHNLSRFDYYDSLENSKPKLNKFYVLKYDLTTWPSEYGSMKITILKDYPGLKLKLYEIENE